MLPSPDLVVRLRGLPWSATVEDVTQFLQGVTFANGVQSIHFICSPDGRASGECYVELAGAEDLDKAITHNREVMGRRYVEVYPAKRAEMDWALNHNGKLVPSVAAQDAIVRLRGLPFGIKIEEIADFLSGRFSTIVCALLSSLRLALVKSSVQRGRVYRWKENRVYVVFVMLAKGWRLFPMG